MVRKAKADGFDAIKTFMIRTPDGPEIHTLSVVADEARRQGLRTFTHAVTVEDTLAAVEAKTDTLAHSPHIGQLDMNPAAVQTIVRSGIPMVSTLGVFIPYFDEHDAPLFRDRGPFPWATLASGGQGPVNARLLWQAGQTYGYGTDSSWLPRESLATELRPLALMFSPREILKIMGINSAVAIGKQDQLGSLERGKIADMVILRGDPSADVTNLLKVAAVVKDGKLVIDNRAPGARAPARRR
jgi:imidazolonepropionase-like amidohydrolase